jgi:deoxyribose-phosphate aldolase
MYYEIKPQDNESDVTDLVEHVSEQVDGVTITIKEGGDIQMIGNAKIQMSEGAIRIGTSRNNY